MKRTMTLVMLTAVLFFTACGPTTDDAIKYNDQIIDQQVKIIGTIDNLYDALEKWTNHGGMDAAYQNAMKQVELGTADVSAMDKFDGSTEFKDAALKLFGIYKSVLDNEFKEMIAINKLPDDQYTTEMKAKFDQLNDMAFKKMDDGLNELQVVQNRFAAKYKFEIEKTNP